MTHSALDAFRSKLKLRVLESLRRTDNSTATQLISFCTLIFSKLLNHIGHVPPALKTQVNSWAAPFDFRISQSGMELELLFVVSQKDFYILPFAIESAIAKLDNFKINDVSIITPSKHINELKSLNRILPEMISIYADEDFISFGDLSQLRIQYENRAGWYIQQILKLEFIRKSLSDAVLVIDADTILTKQRNWINQDGVQVLLLSEEYNAPYYDAIKKLGITPNTGYSFIAHQMLYQPKLVLDMFNKLEWPDSTAICSHITSNYDMSLQSPISLDYELYAQYLLADHHSKVRIQKWSNLGISRDNFENPSDIKRFIDGSSEKYASLSFHSWM